MKLYFTWKDPDGDRYGQLRDQAEENGMDEEELHELVEEILPGGIGEYLSIEVDTETKTYKLVK